MTLYEQYIKRCFTLAKKAGKWTKANPMVGALLVYEGRIIGEGYHHKMGEAHAEVNAINNVKESDKKYIPNATLYVSLEPCNHIGNTGACSHLIVSEGIKNVVVSCTDPNPLVNGSGIDYLRSQNIKVTTGVLKEEGEALIRPFRIINSFSRPYIILKFAQSKDGYMGLEDENVQISGSYTQVLTHKWRSEIDAIMVGTNTVLVDNPKLSTRAVQGDNPLRIVLDRSKRIDKLAHVMSDKYPTVIITEEANNESIPNKKFVNLQFDAQLLEQILSYLYQNDIYIVMVEGGAKLLKSFVKQNLWDEARVITSSSKLFKGIRAPTIIGNLFRTYNIDKDRVQIILPKD